MPTEQTPEPPPAPKKIQREQAQQLGSIYADRTDDFLAALNELLGQSELTVAERVMAMTSDQAAQLIEQLGGKA
jgi:ribosomal protein L15